MVCGREWRAACSKNEPSSAAWTESIRDATATAAAVSERNEVQSLEPQWHDYSLVLAGAAVDTLVTRLVCVCVCASLEHCAIDLRHVPAPGSQTPGV